MCAFLEFMWHYSASEFPEDRVDMRLAMSDDNVLLKLLEALDQGFASQVDFTSSLVLFKL
jgi:hypothetical protein